MRQTASSPCCPCWARSSMRETAADQRLYAGFPQAPWHLYPLFRRSCPVGWPPALLSPATPRFNCLKQTANHVFVEHDANQFRDTGSENDAVLKLDWRETADHNRSCRPSLPGCPAPAMERRCNGFGSRHSANGCRWIYPCRGSGGFVKLSCANWRKDSGSIITFVAGKKWPRMS